MSRQDYEQKLELVCNQGIQKREDTYRKISEEFNELSEAEATPKVEDENLVKLFDVYEETTAEIADIGLPEGSEGKAEELVQEREKAAAKIQADPQGTRNEFSTIFEKPAELAESFGAKSCAI